MREVRLNCLVVVVTAIWSAGLYAQCVEPPADIVSWWPANGDAFDFVGMNDGALENGATFAPGLVGDAFSLDGNDDRVFIGDPATLRLTDSLTLEAWINPVDVPPFLSHGDVATVISKWGQDANLDSYVMSLLRDPDTDVIQLVGAIGVNGDPDPALLGGQVFTGVWNHIATTYNHVTGVQCIYVNGVEVAQRTRPGGINTSDLDVLIGQEDSAFPRPFNGLIDELTIYERALSPAEIMAIFDAYSDGKCFDQDEDGVPDTEDNCPLTANADQADFDGDGIGDECDDDDDNDTILDDNDANPTSDVSATVVVAGNDTGAPNVVFSDGNTMADLANEVVELAPQLTPLVNFLVVLYGNGNLGAGQLGFIFRFLIFVL